MRPYWANLQRVEKATRRLPGNWAEANDNEALTNDLLVCGPTGTNVNDFRAILVDRP